MSPPSAADGDGEGKDEDEEKEEDFVDARENPHTPKGQSFCGMSTPKASLSDKSAAAGARAEGETVRELALENSHLKKDPRRGRLPIRVEFRYR